MLETYKKLKLYIFLIYFYRNFETKFALEKGDVYLFNFDFEVGNELNRAHYCAVLLNSSPRNQLVTIVPLHSLKPNERELNPASEVLLGKIEGLDNGKVSIALINQTRSVDKRRLFDKPTIKNIGRTKRGSNVKEFIAQRKVKYRLSEEQIRILSRAVKNYFTNGYIIHEK